MLKSILRRWRPEPIGTVSGLAEFLDRESAQLAQRSVVGYCHVKTQLPLRELVRDKRFADAFEVSRWEAYAAVLADFLVVTEGVLRPAAAGRGVDLSESLTELFVTILARHAVPAHRVDGWGDLVGQLRQRLAAGRLAPPLPMATVAETSAGRLFQTLPIHERLREPDKPAIVANVQFLMVGLAHEFESGFDHQALVAELVSARGAAA